MQKHALFFTLLGHCDTYLPSIEFPIMGPIIYFFDGKSLSRHEIRNSDYLVDVLMNHFLEGIALLRYWCIGPNEKSNK